ncbi:PilN domain-containing protein [Synechococcus sp. HK05]|uniref:PilN domain-containing protein n=1 Tax=Synechococcus sp. HK05 TaxID=2725975 RepID=UPI001C380A3C|nr:PilN domain-containing protein [Synechococcus sp. HK05]MBV2352438.1 PilN domain-containing protein [Synechococcus sp. HK05]
MKSPSWWNLDWDLLRQRRLERGLSGNGQQLVPATQLLGRGSALGGGVVLSVLLVWGWLQLREGQLDRRLEGLRGIPGIVQTLENQAQQRRRALTAIQRSNEGIANGLVAVSSGSALLAQLAAITPKGIQITDATVQGPNLLLKGLATDPQSFRRVNGLSLLLSQTPLFQPGSVQVVKLVREPMEKGKPQNGEVTVEVPPVAWELNAKLAKLPADRQLALLQKLGADGMARRLLILEQAGVLR